MSANNLSSATEESRNNCDSYLEDIWKILDPEARGVLDFQSLQNGLREINHPMANADQQLQDLIRRIDTNGDGRIQYQEFETVVQKARSELIVLFDAIDLAQSGRLTRAGLEAALRNENLEVPTHWLDGFFGDVDFKCDGYITLDEWLDYLLFMPTHGHSSPLHAILHCYSAVVASQPLHDLHSVSAELQEVLSPSETQPATPRTFKIMDFITEPGYFTAGAIAGGMSRTALAPLDRLKVYLIADTTAYRNRIVEVSKTGKPSLNIPIVNAVKNLWRLGGLRSFFLGNGLNVAKIVPESSIKFATWISMRRFLANLEGHGDEHKLAAGSKFIAGGISGMVAQFFVYPIDTLKFRLQCESLQRGLSPQSLLAHTVTVMHRNGGVYAWYRGLSLGLLGMFPYSAIDMGTFELLKGAYKVYRAETTGTNEEDIQLGSLATGVIGAVSGSLGATMVYPLNVSRTRLQIQGTPMHRPVYTGIWDVANKTLRNEGVRGMYKGLLPNLAKVGPALSITWIAYEDGKQWLKLS